MRKTGLPFLVTILLSVTLLFGLVGCKTGEKITETPVAIEPTQQPSPTPSPAPQKLVLVDPGATVPAEVVNLLSEFSTANGLVFEQIQSLESITLNADTRIAVTVAADQSIEGWAAGSPSTQFIHIGNYAGNGQSNLSVIQARAEDLVFMGGYLTMLTAWDWRAGGMIPNDTALGASYRQAFENGARFVCGQCTSYFSPYYYFPYIVEESTQADFNAWQAQTAPLVEYLVNSVYLDPGIVSPELLDTLTQQGVTFFGAAGTPLAERFTALVAFDLIPGLEQLLPKALAGTGGTVLGAQVVITGITDHKTVSPGKIDAFNKMAADLAAGFVGSLP